MSAVVEVRNDLPGKKRNGVLELVNAIKGGKPPELLSHRIVRL